MRDNSKILTDYIGYLTRTFCTNEIMGRRIKNVSIFLDSGYDISMKGWNKYFKEKLSKDLTVDFSSIKRDIFDFLNSRGVGRYSVRKKRKKIKVLEKLSTISERNRQVMSQFNNAILKENDYSDHTIRSYNHSLKSYFEYCNEFSKDNYRQYISTLEELGRSPQTIALHVSALNRLAESLGRHDLKIKRPKVQRMLSLEKVPSEKEYNMFLDFLKNKAPVYKYIRDKDNTVLYYQIKLLATTGARASEFIQFEWEHIKTGHVQLKGKGGKYRYFFFQKDLQKDMSSYADKNNLTGSIFKNKYGEMMKTRGFAQKLKYYAELAGLDSRKFHPHAFRHFFAKMYLKKNKDVVQLANLLGHENVDTTRIYLTKTFGEQQNEYNSIVNW